MSKSKYSNAFKKRVIDTGIDRLVGRITRQKYYESITLFLNDDDGTIEKVTTNSALFDWNLQVKSNSELDCGMRLNDSKYRKAKKVRDKIGDMLYSGRCIFVTLTFTDDVLAKTSPQTRRRYVARYLKSNCSRYAANIDYGGKNGREHYHAVCDDTLDLTQWHKYGAIKVDRVRTTPDDLMRVSKYVSKLTNHALKVSLNAPRLIYSRNTL